jgi:serine/threonine-protein kinase PknG
MNCTQCSGLVEDGYCIVCGLAPTAEEQYTATSHMLGSSSSSSGITRTGSVRSTRTTTSTKSRRGLLGAGLVEVPPVPYRDPAEAVLDNPEVAERKRFCSKCGEPVGRSRDGRPGRTQGFCPKDGTPFSFTPKLQPGELVGGQYEVLGCLAHGGLGWVYLARDRNVSDRWVVLKGLLDTDDEEATAVAAAEKAFLAEVEHPNIVRIYNFVQHPEPRTLMMVGYIVMEYVGGHALKDVLLSHREQHGEEASLPLGQAIAYAIEVLRAFGYLHGLGLLYCDFKPDNAIQSEEQLKLIDLGGVRRMDDMASAIYGTIGYQAPEISVTGPSISSDLYTVGRSLAVLSFPFKGYTSTYATSLPPRDHIPVLRDNESFDRFLRRATHRDPAERFQDANEMAEQLTGVLREILSAQDGRPRPAPSTLFGPERSTATGELDTASALKALPTPLVSGTDPAAGFLASLTVRDPVALAAALATAPVNSPEIDLKLALVHIELGEHASAKALLDQAGDWRADWYLAFSSLAANDLEIARERFDDLCSLAPGELAPKLALAFCNELSGRTSEALRYYEAVWRTDHTFVSAAFGLARVRLGAGDRGGAVAALDAVPAVSSQFQTAQIAAVNALVLDRKPEDLTEADLVGAGERLTGLALDAERHSQLAIGILTAALDWVIAGTPSQATVLEAPLNEEGLRRRLERLYRGLARAADGQDRHALIDQANSVRPRTLI